MTKVIQKSIISLISKFLLPTATANSPAGGFAHRRTATATLVTLGTYKLKTN
ncbi:MAG: hypothetical protein JW956_14445 [Calditrichaceae bacterium]|nr:hypothetical protein [Calditrichaceae bacterium]